MDIRKSLLAIVFGALMIGSILLVYGIYTLPRFAMDSFKNLFMSGLLISIGFLSFGIGELFTALSGTFFWKKGGSAWSLVTAGFGVLGFVLTILMLMSIIPFWTIWALLYLISAAVTLLGLTTMIGEIEAEGDYGWMPKITKGMFYIGGFYFLVALVLPVVNGYLIAIPAGALGLIFVYQTTE